MTAREALSILKLQSISLKRVNSNLAFDVELEIIEKELNQLEEDKQNLTEANLELCELNHKQAVVIGIIKRKKVNVGLLFNDDYLEDYNERYVNKELWLTQIEWDLLKEKLCD